MKRQYQIMIAVGAAKGSGLFEVWITEGNGFKATDHVHCGYFQKREDAQSYIDYRIDQDCPSNSEQSFVAVK